MRPDLQRILRFVNKIDHQFAFVPLLVCYLATNAIGSCNFCLLRGFDASTVRVKMFQTYQASTTYVDVAVVSGSSDDVSRTFGFRKRSTAMVN